MIREPDPDFARWYRELLPSMVATLRGLGQSPEDAAEIAAEAFARALERWPRVREMERPDGWTYRVAVNLAKRRASSRRRERDTLYALSSRPSATGPVEDASPIEDLVAALPWRMRQVVVLRHVADLTEPAIADLLGISRGTVSSTLRDAHRRLATELMPTSEPESASEEQTS